jgi:hypothetical protein
LQVDCNNYRQLSFNPITAAAGRDITSISSFILLAFHGRREADAHCPTNMRFASPIASPLQPHADLTGLIEIKA